MIVKKWGVKKELRIGYRFVEYVIKVLFFLNMFYFLLFLGILGVGGNTN